MVSSVEYFDIGILMCIAALMLLIVPLQLSAYRLLKNRHRATYTRLGEPGLANAQAWWTKGYWGWIGFLYSAEYRTLDDPSLNRVCSWLRLLNALLYVAAIALVIRVIYW
jgi:hypothetical protein